MAQQGTDVNERQTARPSAGAMRSHKAAPRVDTGLRAQWARLALIVGSRKSVIAALAVSSTAAAMCEAGILAVAARTATALVGGSGQVSGRFGPFPLNVSTRELLYVGIALAAIRLLLQIPTSFFPARIAGDVQASMRARLIAAYSRGSWELQSQDREGHFQEMMTNQIQQASQGAMQSTQLVISFFTFLILVISAFALNPVAAISVFAAAIVLFAALRPANALASRLSRRLSAAQLEYAGSVGEANRMTEETNVFGVAEPQSARVIRFVLGARELFVKTQVLGKLIPNVYQSMIYFILVLGLLAIDVSGLSGFSSLGAVVLLLVRAGTYGQALQTAWVALRQSLPYVERLQAAIDAYTASTPERGDTPLRNIESLAFERVTYHYREDQPVLKDLSFVVNGGETIGVVGPSGAGKSTMVQILLQLREPRSGRFLINGTNAANIRPSDWHERVAYVPQQPKLIHASVADNVRFFRDYDDAAVEHACRMARIHDEVMSWPAGYQTIVGPRADAVSGGQQQRICLARALVSNPSMLVLDEPTSALDPRSEALIQESLEALQRELTLFIIAHRMSTLSICDRVMVVLDGTLDAIDTLSELTASNSYYRFASGLASGISSLDQALDFESTGPAADLGPGSQPPT